MMIKFLLFEQRGRVNDIFAILPAIAYNRKDAKERNRKIILDAFRLDREVRMPDEKKNPSKNILDIKFHYNPFMEKQFKYTKLPYELTDTINIIDIFVCSGSRFSLKPLMVVVEVCESKCTSNPIWANIYYVANSEIPVSTITIKAHSMFLDEYNMPAETGQDVY